MRTGGMFLMRGAPFAHHGRERARGDRRVHVKAMTLRNG